VIERGIVSKISNDLITIDINPEAVCAACGIKTKSELAIGCKSCNLFKNNQKKQLIAVNSKKLPVKLDNIVDIHLSSAKVIKAAFFFFILPIVLFLVGYLIIDELFSHIDDYIKALGGIIGLALGFFIIFIRKLVINKRDWPQVVKIIQRK